MPQTNTYDLQASKIRPKDRLIQSHGTFAVASVDVKTKYTYVTFVTDSGSSQSFKFENERWVTVERTEPTEAEVEAQRRKFDNELIQAAIVRAADKLETVRQSLVDHFGRDLNVDWSDLNELIEAQESNKLWTRVQTIVNHDGEDVTDFAEARDRVIEKCKETLLNDWLRGTSTDAYSNAITATTRAVYSRFVSRSYY